MLLKKMLSCCHLFVNLQMVPKKFLYFFSLGLSVHIGSKYIYFLPVEFNSKDGTVSPKLTSGSSIITSQIIRIERDFGGHLVQSPAQAGDPTSFLTDSSPISS
uniref:Uncharacterized protein n=1 Tax=Micrurus lemniscatus lemniscatus TaxID=129467 RepID=A0A2D4I2R8_MICLE